MNPIIIAILSLFVIALFLFITAFFLHQQTQNKETIHFISSSASSPASYSKGEKVEVYYLASNPQEAKIKNFFSLRGVEFIFILLGFIFFSAAIGLLFLPKPS